MRLTKPSVAALEARETRYIVFDDALPGFGVRVMPSKSKSYICEYRAKAAGRSAPKRRSTLGSFEKITLDDARRQAKALFAVVARGGDPMADARAEREADSVKDVAALWMENHIQPKRKLRTVEEYQRLLDKKILPAFGRKKLKDLGSAEVARLHEKVSKASPVSANKMLAVLSSLWTWSSKRKVVRFEDNPCKGLDRNPESGRERYLSEAELGRLGEALRLGETTGLPWQVGGSISDGSKHLAKAEKQFTVLSPYAVAALRLLILTGARLREVLNLRWDEVDFERGIIFLKDSKTGKKPIILNAPALVVLAGLPREDGCPYALPGEGGTPRSDLKRPWAQVCHAAGLHGLRLHDLRHSNASVAAGAGVSLPLIGKLLGHAQASTTQRYVHLADDPLRRAAELIGSRISDAMGGTTGDGSNVTPLRRA